LHGLFLLFEDGGCIFLQSLNIFSSDYTTSKLGSVFVDTDMATSDITQWKIVVEIKE
jgi:hypothetical protein